MEARNRGLPDLPLALTSHPLGGIRDAEVLEKAEGLVDAVIRAVCERNEGRPGGTP
jgi:hypothetical protein